MHILVCVKEVIDPEIPSSAFRIDAATRTPDVAGAAYVTSVFDANALETGLKLRDAIGGTASVSVLSIGKKSAELILRKALGCSANAAVLVADDAIVEPDPAGIATTIAAVVRKFAREGKPVDLVLTGRQAADVEHGQTGGMLAEALGWPALTFVSKMHPTADGIEARREVEDGHMLVHARPPFVVTITNDETNQPRLAKVRDVMMSNRAKIPAWSLADLELTPADVTPRVRILELATSTRENRCEFIDGDSPAAKADTLVARLRELKLV